MNQPIHHIFRIISIIALLAIGTSMIAGAFFTAMRANKLDTTRESRQTEQITPSFVPSHAIIPIDNIDFWNNLRRI